MVSEPPYIQYGQDSFSLERWPEVKSQVPYVHLRLILACGRDSYTCSFDSRSSPRV